MYLYQDLNRRPSTIEGYRMAIADTLGLAGPHISQSFDLDRLLSSFHRDRPKSAFRLDKTSHITSCLQKLHWFPISYCILFKYNLITYKTIKFSQPTYLSSLIKISSLTCGNGLSLSSVHPKKAIGRVSKPVKNIPV